MSTEYLLKKYLLLSFLLASGFFCFAQDEPVTLTEQSSHCIQCHGNHYYKFYNKVTDTEVKKLMNPYYFIDSTKYVKAIHSFFSCEDCHSADYANYPHSSELKLEPKLSCIDCHGGDETFAKYQFDQMAEEVGNSVHKKAFGEQFKCEMCHDLHSCKLGARKEKSKITEIVKQDNEMCLSCHNNLSKYQILTDNQKPELLKTHDWLPNQELHFLYVRCIECHTPVTDTVMVSHNILPKEKAVHLCSDCHSTNSILSDKLYKYAAIQSRNEGGYYNSVILNEAYVIGANRNKYLNIISLLILAMAIGGISLHIVARIINKK